MKKTINSWILCLVMACLMPLCFVSCSSDDDTSDGNNGLVGKWYHVKDVFDDGDVDECGDKDCYWEFSSDKLTCHDVDDIMNGKPMPYKYEGKTLTIGGIPMYEVKKLTSSELVLFIDASYMTQTVYFKR